MKTLIFISSFISSWKQCLGRESAEKRHIAKSIKRWHFEVHDWALTDHTVDTNGQTITLKTQKNTFKVNFLIECLQVIPSHCESLCVLFVRWFSVDPQSFPAGSHHRTPRVAREPVFFPFLCLRSAIMWFYSEVSPQFVYDDITVSQINSHLQLVNNFWFHRRISYRWFTACKSVKSTEPQIWCELKKNPSHLHVCLPVHDDNQKLSAFQREILIYHLCIPGGNYIFSFILATYFIYYLAGDPAGFTHCTLLNLSSNL